MGELALSGAEGSLSRGARDFMGSREAAFFYNVFHLYPAIGVHRPILYWID